MKSRATNDLPGAFQRRRRHCENVGARSFAGGPVDGLTSVRKNKRRGGGNGRRNAEEFDLRRGAATAGSIIVARPRACGRGLNCVPFLSNFFNLSRLGQLITGRNDFRLAADGSFGVHDGVGDDDGGGGDDDGDGGASERPIFRIPDHWRSARRIA